MRAELLWTALLFGLGIAFLLTVFTVDAFVSGRACPAFPNYAPWDCFDYWLNRYQALIAGALAVAGAAATVIYLDKQIRSGRQQFALQMRVQTFSLRLKIDRLLRGPRVRLFGIIQCGEGYFATEQSRRVVERHVAVRRVGYHARGLRARIMDDDFGAVRELLSHDEEVLIDLLSDYTLRIFGRGGDLNDIVEFIEDDTLRTFVTEARSALTVFDRLRDEVDSWGDPFRPGR